MITFTFMCNECGVAVSTTGKWDSAHVREIEMCFAETHEEHYRGI